jgi:hypothetical protein
METSQMYCHIDKMRHRKLIQIPNDVTTTMSCNRRTLILSISNLYVSSAPDVASNFTAVEKTTTSPMPKTESWIADFAIRTLSSLNKQIPMCLWSSIVSEIFKIWYTAQECSFWLSQNKQKFEYKKTQTSYRIPFPSTFVWLVYILSFCASRSYAQVYNTSEPCMLEMYVYRSTAKCQTYMNGIGTIIPDGTCRSVDINPDSTPNISDYSLFPGNYRAQCTWDGSKVRFSESGCTDQECKSIIIGEDVCNRDNDSLSSLYSRMEVPEYDVKQKSAMNSTAFQDCTPLQDETETVMLKFHIVGDCTNPNCPKLPDLSSPVQSPASQRISNQPSAKIPSSDISLQPTLQLRNDTAKITMVLSFVANGTLSDEIAGALEATLKEQVNASAFYDGNKVKRIYFTEFKEENSVRSLQSGRLLSEPTTATGIKGNRIMESVQAHMWTMLDTNDNMNNRRKLQEDESSKQTLRIVFDFFVIFRMGTGDDVSAGTVMNNAFNTEQKQVAFIEKLKLKNDDVFKNIEKIEVTTDEIASPTSTPNLVSGISGDSTSDSGGSGNNSLGLIIGVACGSFVFLVVVGFFLYRRGQKDALSQAKNENPIEGELSPSSTYLSSQQHQPQMQSNERWTNEIIIDPSSDDVSTLGGSTLAELNMMRNGQRGVVDEDEHTASVNVDYDFARNRYRTGATHEDATIDDRSRGAYTNHTNPTIYTTLSKYGGPSLVADDDMSFDRQYVDDGDADDEMQNQQSQFHNTADSFEVTNEGGILTTNNRIINTKNNFDGLKISPNVSMQNHVSESSPPAGSGSPTDSTGTWLTKPFEIHVPPGVLGMVIDTPGGSTPVVRAIKNNSVLVGQVLIGDRLLSVDQIDVSKMPAMQVSNLISTRSHLNRVLMFVRPIPSSVTTASDSQR